VELECQECGSDQQGAGSSVGEGRLHVTDHVEVTSVKDEIREWTGVFHNHSAIYTKYKNICTKTTSTLQRRHVQHSRGTVTGLPFLLTCADSFGCQLVYASSLCC
jgi:hypothetical protein